MFLITLIFFFSLCSGFANFANWIILGWPTCWKEPSFQAQYYLNQSLVLLWEQTSWWTPWPVIDICHRNISLVYYQSFSLFSAWSSRGGSRLPSIIFFALFQHLFLSSKNKTTELLLLAGAIHIFRLLWLIWLGP